MNFITKLFINNYVKNILPVVVDKTLTEVLNRYAPLSLAKEDLINLIIAQVTNSVKVPWYLVPFKNIIIANIKDNIQNEVRNRFK